MPFYMRKSIKVGPLRYNLSKSGIGVSVGIPGFRVGSGPKENYVHMGKNGVYFRQSLSSQQTQIRSQEHQEISPTRVYESKEASQLKDATAADLLKELNRKIEMPQYTGLFLIAAGLLLWLSFIKGFPDWALLAGVIVCIAIAFYLYNQDELRRSVVLFYEFEKEEEKEYSQLTDAVQEFLSCERLWRIETTSEVSNQKYHAGANNLVTRKVIGEKKLPSIIKTNIDVSVIDAGEQVLAFFPERILVIENKSVGAVSYTDLQISVSPTRFIESSTLPEESQVVDWTWKYVNKSGGPDRRFSDNPKYPIV